MKLNIHRDARPQAMTLLLAAALSIALWFIPYAEILTYPFRIFVTFIHEGGHALAALLTLKFVTSLSVSPDTSGLTQWTSNGEPGMLTRIITSSAGYVGAMLYGALLLFLIRRAVAARLVLLGSAVYVFILATVFGVLMPILSGTWASLAGIPFTLLAGLVISIGLFAVARFASPRVATFFLSFLAVQCVLNALLDLKNVLFMSSPFALSVPTDARILGEATGIPAIFWAVLWIGIAIAILTGAMRIYAVSKNQAAAQQDLPFEEPLEV